MKLTDEQIAALKYALVKTMEDVPQEVVDKIILELDPPANTTLRGWVLWTRSNDDDMRFVMWADDKGLFESPDSMRPMFDWEEFEGRHEPLAALTPEDIGFRIRRWDEWSDEEQIKLADTRRESVYNRDVVNLAIDIATKQEDV